MTHYLAALTEMGVTNFVVATWLPKSGWGGGPWDDEPDRLSWIDPDSSLPCLALRHINLGHWCGYVGVPVGHRYYASQAIGALEVHGKVTGAGVFSVDPDIPEREQITMPGYRDAFWIGFDCAHGDDLIPAALPAIRAAGFESGTYRTLNVVVQEIVRLLHQLT